MGRDRERMARQTPNIYVMPKGSGIRTVPIREDIRDSPAYHVLSGKARLILFDMIAAHCRATKWENNPTCFTYTWNNCREPCSESTFSDARREILAAGFFEMRPEDQGNEPGGPFHYRSSARWLTFEPSSEQAEAIRSRKAAKAKRVGGQHLRRKRYRVSLKTYHDNRGSTEEPSP